MSGALHGRPYPPEETRLAQSDLSRPTSKSEPDSLIRPAGLPERASPRTLQSLYVDRHGAPILDTLQTALKKPGLLSPIIFYGPAGTGKTHLLQGLESDARSRKLSVYHLSFSSGNETPTDLHDLLLIDGLHHFPTLSTEKQDEFSILFERHFESRKQIFASTEIEIGDLELPDRLQSRILSGLTLELRLPEGEDRFDFIQKRLAEFDMQIPAERLRALNLPENLSYRDLESVSAMIFLYSRNGWSDARLAEALQNRFAPQTQKERPIITIEQILETVLKRFSVTREDLLGKSRRAEHTLPRHIAMTLAQEFTGLNKSSIARFFQRSDHSVVIHAVKKMQDSLRTEPTLKQLYDRLLKDLGLSVNGRHGPHGSHRKR